MRKGAIEAISYYETYGEELRKPEYIQNFPHGYPEVKPDTINKAIDILITYMSEEEKDNLTNLEKETFDSVNYFGIGLWIRYNYELWYGNDALMKELGCTDPVDALMILIATIWQQLQDDSKAKV